MVNKKTSNQIAYRKLYIANCISKFRKQVSQRVYTINYTTKTAVNGVKCFTVNIWTSNCLYYCINHALPNSFVFYIILPSKNKRKPLCAKLVWDVLNLTTALLDSMSISCRPRAPQSWKYTRSCALISMTSWHVPRRLTSSSKSRMEILMVCRSWTEILQKHSASI